MRTSVTMQPFASAFGTKRLGCEMCLLSSHKIVILFHHVLCSYDDVPILSLEISREWAGRSKEWRTEACWPIFSNCRYSSKNFYLDKVFYYKIYQWNEIFNMKLWSRSCCISILHLDFNLHQQGLFLSTWRWLLLTSVGLGIRNVQREWHKTAFHSLSAQKELKYQVQIQGEERCRCCICCV